MSTRESRARFTPGNAWRYLKAVASLAILGATPTSTRLARAKACLGCEHRRSRPGSAEPIGWCGACGCGSSDRSALSKKVQMPGATCPKGRWP
jgi:hypothetical protein